MSLATPLDAALWLAEYGAPSFPCLENKRPACPHGLKDATKDPVALRELWTRYPGFFAGVPTGVTTGFDVLDIDPRNGGDQWLASMITMIPQTQMHRTRSGGLHLLFKHHDGLRNSASKIAPGVDVRGDGGYVIWWPVTGLEAFNSGVLAEWPGWLLQKLSPEPRNSSRKISRQNNKYAHQALQKAVEAVLAAPEGTRNQCLNAEAYSLGKFMPSGELLPQEIAVALTRASITAGLDRNEIINTIASALRAQGV